MGFFTYVYTALGLCVRAEAYSMRGWFLGISPHQDSAEDLQEDLLAVLRVGFLLYCRYDIVRNLDFSNRAPSLQRPTSLW